MPQFHIVKPAEWTDPMNLDLLRQGTLYKEGIAKENINELSQISSQLASIPAYGKDAEKLQEKLQELKANMSNLNLGNVGDYNTVSQIKGLVNNFTNDPETMDIIQKWSPYEKERKIQEEMRLKDKDYFSPIIDQGNSYIQNGEYIKGKRFTGNGFINKNLTKEYQEILSKVQKQKKQVVKNGVVIEELSYDPDELDRITDEFYSNPAFKQQIEYQINKDSNVDWEKQGQQILTKHADLYKNNISLKEQQLLTTKNPKKYQEIAQDIESYKQEVSKLEQMAASQDNAEYAKSYYINNMLDDLKTQAKEKAQFFSQESRKYDEKYMEGVKTSNDIKKDREKQILELELASGISRNTPNFFSVASSKVQTDKQTNAKLANPNYKITSSDAIIGYTEKQWGENVFVTKNGVTKIPDNPGSKTMIKKLILSDPNKFPEIPQEVIEVLQNDPNADIIDIVDGNIEIDPSYWNPIAPKYKIKAVDALQRKNEIMKPKDGSTQPTSATGSESKLSPINGFEVTQYTIGNDTVTAPIITNLSDTSKIDKGAYFSYNGKLYTNE